MTDLSKTIVAKSDQLNADDLLVNALTIKITKVSVNNGDQPVVINYEGDNGKPYKPSKSMRRVLTKVWGTDGDKYIGKTMTLYNDPSVKWAGADVGGIRISHMSDMEAESLKLPLTLSRGKKILYTVNKLTINELQEDDLKKWAEKINSAKTKDELKAISVELKTANYQDGDFKNYLTDTYKKAMASFKSNAPAQENVGTENE